MTSPPRVGLAGWRLPGDHFGAAELAHQVGAAGLQLDLGGPGRGPWLDAPGTVRRLREDCSRLGLELFGVAGNTLNDIGLTAPAGTRDALRAERVLVRVLDTARALGAPLAFAPSFRRSAIGDLSELRRTAVVLAWAAREAEARGLLLASENGLDPRRACALVEEVAVPSFRLVLDTYNPRVCGVDVLELIEATHEWIAPQIHLKDGTDGVAGQEPLGEGDGRVWDALSALRAHTCAVDALILENDYRDGDLRRLSLDVERADAHARTESSTEPAAGVQVSTVPSTYETTALMDGVVSLGSRAFPGDALGDDVVVIKPEYVGICRADIKEIIGSRDVMEDRGPLFGHEIVGTVTFSGARTGVRTGETVTLNPNITPTRTTGFAEYVFVRGTEDQLAQAVVPVPEPDIRDHIWMPEPFACIVHALRKLLELVRLDSLEGKRVGIIGAGCAGLMFAMYARHLGASVSVFNRGAMRREFARERGILAEGESYAMAEARVRRDAFDLVVVTPTRVTEEVLEIAGDMAVDGAALLVYGGTREGDGFPGSSVDIDAIRRNERIEPVTYKGKRLDITGAYGCFREDYEEGFRLRAENPEGFPLERLASRQIGLGEFPALAMSVAAGAEDFPGKVLIKLERKGPGVDGVGGGA